MINHIWCKIAENDMGLIDAVNEYRESQGKDAVTVEAPALPFPRIPYCEAIEIVKQGGGD